MARRTARPCCAGRPVAWRSLGERLSASIRVSSSPKICAGLPRLISSITSTYAVFRVRARLRAHLQERAVARGRGRRRRRPPASDEVLVGERGVELQRPGHACCRVSLHSAQPSRRASQVLPVPGGPCRMMFFLDRSRSSIGSELARGDEAAFVADRVDVVRLAAMDVGLGCRSDRARVRGGRRRNGVGARASIHAAYENSGNELKGDVGVREPDSQHLGVGQELLAIELASNESIGGDLGNVRLQERGVRRVVGGEVRGP